MYESQIEKLVIDLISELGFSFIEPEVMEIERGSLSDVVLVSRLKNAIWNLNPNLPDTCKEQALRKILTVNTTNLLENNETFHKILIEGVDVEYSDNGVERGAKVRIIDFENPENNEYIVTNQFTVIEQNYKKRPDVVLLVNGLPLVVIELKNAADEKATIESAYNQLQTYKTVIPALFTYNELMIASDGIEARVGTLTADISRFAAWKSINGITHDSKTNPQVETMIKGMLKKEVLLDLIQNFTVFERSSKIDTETGQTLVSKAKKVAQYHQYYAVNKAVESTLRATADSEMTLREPPASYGLPSVEDQPIGDHKAGVMWHTQGSGKSLSMVFYTGKIVQKLGNPTIVVVTDRNDLDGQLFDTFANCQSIIRQTPVQAESIENLKELLKVNSGGIVFTTIQKFTPTEGQETFELLSNRSNIVVIADEAHRSHYGFGGHELVKNYQVHTKYGHAKYIRDAIPNATFIGFTGTPIEKIDASTPAVFGNYIDVYDIEQAVKDGATVKIYYESRLARLHLKDEQIAQIDQEIDEVAEGQQFDKLEQAKAKWAELEAIVGNKERLKMIANDILTHFRERTSAIKGKAMIVCMSRSIAVDLYNEIINFVPEWENADLLKGKIKVVMTTSSSDPIKFQKHHTSKTDRKKLADRFKDPDDELELVIVRDMWLTGFDVPCLHTMYIDKPMKEHNLMQAIARVNRVYKDKPSGLIVDYIGIASDLKAALSVYTQSGGKGKPALDQNEAVAQFLSRLEIVGRLLNGFNYKRYFSANTHEKLTILIEAQEFILEGKEKAVNEYIKQVIALSKAFSIAVPHEETLKHKDEVALFQAIKARLMKLQGTPEGKKSMTEIEAAIKQIVDSAIVTDHVVDIFDAAGIKKPDISILSDEFLAEVREMEHKNLAVELLKKLLNDEIKFRQRTNIVQSRKFSEMLQGVINRYNNNLLTTVEVLNELMKIGKEMRDSDNKNRIFGLTDEEVAFYDALASNKSALDAMGDQKLAFIAREVRESVRQNASIDWEIRESAKARLRMAVKRVLNKYGYPPDMQKAAIDGVIQQAELWTENALA